MEKMIKATQHKVTHIFSGRNHIFKVDSISGESYDIAINVSCTCRFQSVQGTPNGNNLCSHILSVLNEMGVHVNGRK